MAGAVDSDRFYAAKRFALGCVLLWVLWGLAGNVVGFTSLVVKSTRDSHAIIAAQNKTLSPSELETELKKMNAFGLVAHARTDLHCEPRMGAWGFVCNFLPTPTTSAVRVQFGVTVDGNRSIFEISRLCPINTALPAPEKLLLVR